MSEPRQGPRMTTTEIPRGPFAGSHNLNVHTQRLKSEADAVLLRNRLERLRQEEAKAMKRITETRRRAGEIKALKMRNEVKTMEKRGHLVEQRRVMEEARQRVFVHKLERQGGLEEGRRQVIKQKRDIADQTRQERSTLAGKVAQQRERETRRAKQIFHTIKEHEQQVQYFKMQERMAHEERLQTGTQRKMVLEEAKRREAEQLVHDMEASEELLIERLRRTQEAQKLAYEELEQALSMLSPRDAAVRELQREPLVSSPGLARGRPGSISPRLMLMPPKASSLPPTPRSASRSPRMLGALGALNMYSGQLAAPPLGLKPATARPSPSR
ncbi:hypothetical protein T492DRAFT_618492 [Pavlovales sp. CCMP2436]|nr:hypothetical protein T492DRAFT_618492 [Pavlovales sp. CCMP2436]